MRKGGRRVVRFCTDVPRGTSSTNEPYGWYDGATEFISPLARTVDLTQIRYSTAYDPNGVTQRECLKSSDFTSSGARQCLECDRGPT